MKNADYYREFSDSYKSEALRYAFILNRDGLEKSQEWLEFLYDLYIEVISKEKHFGSSIDYRNKFLGSIFYCALHLQKLYLQKSIEISDLTNILTENHLSDFEVAIQHKDTRGIFNSIINDLCNPICDYEILFKTIYPYRDEFK